MERICRRTTASTAELRAATIGASVGDLTRPEHPIERMIPSLSEGDLTYISIVDVFTKIGAANRVPKRIDRRVLPAAVAVVRMPRLHEDNALRRFHGADRRLHFVNREGQRGPIPSRAPKRIETQYADLIAAEIAREIERRLKLVRIRARHDCQERGADTRVAQEPDSVRRRRKASRYASHEIMS